MKEWILENTDVTEEEYDKLINPNTLNVKGESKPITNMLVNKISDHPMLAIDEFTKQPPTLYRKIKYRVIKKKKAYIHKKIKFIILAELIDDMKEILYSQNRKGKCFTLSIDIFKKYNNVNILTLMCIDPYFKEPKPFLHVVTSEKDEHGNEIIFDTTYNIAMKKETYLKLLQATIISTISKEKIKNDHPLIIELVKNDLIYLDEYFCFRDQITSAVKKLSKNNK